MVEFWYFSETAIFLLVLFIFETLILLQEQLGVASSAPSASSRSASNQPSSEDMAVLAKRLSDSAITKGTITGFSIT